MHSLLQPDLNKIFDDDIFLVDYPLGNGSRVHQGFYRTWLNLAEKMHFLINNTLALHCPSCDHIVCTGHSLGAV